MVPNYGLIETQNIKDWIGRLLLVPKITRAQKYEFNGVYIIGQISMNFVCTISYSTYFLLCILFVLSFSVCAYFLVNLQSGKPFCMKLVVAQ